MFYHILIAACTKFIEMDIPSIANLFAICGG